ncbi:MAG: formylglycine-generating enzyme family protein [Planctomycetes bacterium]|nr:formylglycine-generating enzyme family protein [Planctomycetota bacterium]
MRSLCNSTLLVFLLSAIALSGLLRAGGAAKDDGDGTIAGLVRQLGDREYVKREAAGDALKAIGEKALPALRRAVDSPDLETCRRARQLVRAIMMAVRRSQSTGLTMVVIDAGEFQMGAPQAERGRRQDELQHRVRITSSFLLGAHEVSQAEYRKVMKADPSWFRSDGPGKDRLAALDTARFPVERASWYDAIEFCNRLSKLDGYKPYYKVAEVKTEDGTIKSARVTIVGGNGYRLPTEAEWEYACRAGTRSPYHFGFAITSRQANVKTAGSTGGYGVPTTPTGLERTTKVGSYAPNHWGLYDMHGNVAEWCWDWYHQDYYKQSPVNDPSGPATGTHRVLRGGSWLVSNGSSRSANRVFLIPADKHFDAGFRVARTP